MRLLDTGSQGHGLLADSRAGSGRCSPAWSLPSPSLLLCTMSHRVGGGIKGYVAEVSVPAGKIVRRLPLPGVYADDLFPEVAWANPAGTKAIVLIGRSFSSSSAYLVTRHSATKLPGATWLGALSSYLPASW
jgi:hypothetical protein